MAAFLRADTAKQAAFDERSNRRCNRGTRKTELRNKPRLRKAGIVFKFNKKIVVMGLWRKKNMMMDFTSLELAVDWFRRIVAEDKDLLLHNRERLK